MNRLIERCAMLDIHKSQITACVRVPDGDGGRHQEVREFQTVTSGLLTLADWLRSYAVTTVLRAVENRHARAAFDRDRRVGYERRSKSGARSLRTFDVVGGVAAPSAGVKRRRTHARTHGRLSRRLTRRRRAQLGGGQVVPGARPRETALRRQRWVTVQQPARQPYRAFPRADLVATEPQHPRPNGEHDRLDRIAQLAVCRGDRDRFWVQRNDPPGRARAQTPRASAGGAQPATHRALWPPQTPGDRSMPDPGDSQAQRFADHLRPVAPARNRPRGREHVRRLARGAERPPRGEPPYLAGQPHLARAREPPGRQSRRAGRTRELSGCQRSLHALWSDRDLKHRRSVTRSPPPKPPRQRRGREGAAGVGHLPDARQRRLPETYAPSPP